MQRRDYGSRRVCPDCDEEILRAKRWWPATPEGISGFIDRIERGMTENFKLSSVPFSEWLDAFVADEQLTGALIGLVF